MPDSDAVAALSPRVAWNKDRVVGRMKTFNLEEAQHFREHLEAEARKKPARMHDLTLFNLVPDAMCCASEVLALKVMDVTNHLGRVVDELDTLQEKTGRTKMIALKGRARLSL